MKIKRISQIIKIENSQPLKILIILLPLISFNSCISDKKNYSSNTSKTVEKQYVRKFADEKNIFLDYYEGMNAKEIEFVTRKLIKNNRLKIIIQDPGHVNSTEVLIAKEFDLDNLFEKKKWLNNVVYEFSLDGYLVYGTVRFHLDNNELKKVTLICPAPIHQFSDLTKDLGSMDTYSNYKSKQWKIYYTQYNKPREKFLSYILPLYTKKYGTPIHTKKPVVKKDFFGLDLTSEYETVFAEEKYVYNSNLRSVVISFGGIFNGPFIIIDNYTKMGYLDMIEERAQKMKNDEIQRREKQIKIDSIKKSNKHRLYSDL